MVPSFVELAVLNRGDFFGEMSVLEGLPRDASTHAVGETEVLVRGSSPAARSARQHGPEFALFRVAGSSGRGNRRARRR